jgi:hypothetical protein
MEVNILNVSKHFLKEFLFVWFSKASEKEVDWWETFLKLNRVFTMDGLFKALGQFYVNPHFKHDN